MKIKISYSIGNGTHTDTIPIEDDADFISESRSIVPELVAEVEKLSGLATQLARRLGDNGGCPPGLNCEGAGHGSYHGGCANCWREWAEKEAGK